MFVYFASFKLPELRFFRNGSDKARYNGTAPRVAAFIRRRTVLRGGIRHRPVPCCAESNVEELLAY